MPKKLGVVVSMPGASVTEDGTIVEMELKISDGSVQTLRFSPTLFLSLVNRTFELFVNERMKKAASQGHIESQPLPVVTTFAQEAVGGQAVILGVRLQNGLPVEFSIPPAEAEELHKQLGAAVEKAKLQSSSKRH